MAVLGLIVWLVSLDIFKGWVLAGTLAAGTLVLLAAGWYVTLRTRFKVAGQALTFLACVVAPLNLWFLDAQNLVTLGAISSHPGCDAFNPVGVADRSAAVFLYN